MRFLRCVCAPHLCDDTVGDVAEALPGVSALGALLLDPIEQLPAGPANRSALPKGNGFGARFWDCSKYQVGGNTGDRTSLALASNAVG